MVRDDLIPLRIGASAVFGHGVNFVLCTGCDVWQCDVEKKVVRFAFVRECKGVLSWRCCPIVWQAQMDFACRITFDVIRTMDRNGDHSWRGGDWHDTHARRNGDINRGRDREQAALLAPRASHRDSLHGTRERESHAFDFITEDADKLRWREWQMEVLRVVELVNVVVPFVCP